LLEVLLREDEVIAPKWFFDLHAVFLLSGGRFKRGILSLHA